MASWPGAPCHPPALRATVPLRRSAARRRSSRHTDEAAGSPPPNSGAAAGPRPRPRSIDAPTNCVGDRPPSPAWSSSIRSDAATARSRSVARGRLAGDPRSRQVGAESRRAGMHASAGRHRLPASVASRNARSMPAPLQPVGGSQRQHARRGQRCSRDAPVVNSSVRVNCTASVPAVRSSTARIDVTRGPIGPARDVDDEVDGLAHQAC